MSNKLVPQNQPVNKAEKCFTFYTAEGFKICLNGEDSESAWSNAYSYELTPVFFEEGYTDSHYFTNGFWLKREPVVLSIDEYIALDSNIERQKLYDDSHNLNVVLNNGDIMAIEEKSTSGFLDRLPGMVIAVFYCERHEGSYSGNGDEEYHYMVCNEQYYNSNDPEYAMRVFQARLFAAHEKKPLADVYKGSGQSLEEIIEAQVLY